MKTVTTRLPNSFQVQSSSQALLTSMGEFRVRLRTSHQLRDEQGLIPPLNTAHTSEYSLPGVGLTGDLETSVIVDQGEDLMTASGLLSDNQIAIQFGRFCCL